MSLLDQFGRPVDPVPVRKTKIGFGVGPYHPNGKMKAETPTPQPAPQEQA
jgi:hypothetical protein